jgi:glycosyltransferase involved in cell wall biosynthesis
MRIAMLGPANSIHLQRWATGLAGRGHEIGLLTQHVHDPQARWVPGVEHLTLPWRSPAGYMLNAPALRRRLAGWRPDVLSVHYASGYGTLAALAGFQPSRLSVWGSDVYEFPSRSPLHRAWLRANLRRATAIGSTSLAMAQQVRTLWPGVGEIAITPFGVDLDRFVPPTRNAQPGRFTIGIVKSLDRLYGVDLLIRAFARLMADPDVCVRQPEARLLIVGDGPQRAELQALAASLGVVDRTRFAGRAPHDEVPGWLQQLDVFAAPSRQESFGVAVVEAGACGLPSVVTAVGGLPEVVLHERTGLVVPAENPAALAAALRRLALEPETGRRLGAAARAHVASTYAWPASLDAMEAALARTVARWGRR